MDADIDLSAMPREDLLALIAQLQAVVQEQQTVIAQLQRRIETLEEKAKPGRPQRDARHQASNGPAAP